jgi:Uma2 family endonuclease
MVTATLIPVEEYLSKTWRPDREYVDGRLVQRHVGELHHSYLQGLFRDLLKKHGLFSFEELRTQVKGRRYRVPDVLGIREMPKTRFLREPPYIIVGILSRDDRASDVADAIDDYVEFGIPNIWVVDPEHRRISACNREGSRYFIGQVETTDGSLSIPLDEIFGQMPVIED